MHDQQVNCKKLLLPTQQQQNNNKNNTFRMNQCRHRHNKLLMIENGCAKQKQKCQRNDDDYENDCSSALATFPIQIGHNIDNNSVVFRPFRRPQFFAVFIVVVLLQFLLFLPANFVLADQNLLVDTELFSADIISQAFVQTGSELHYLHDISHHHHQQQQHHHQQQQQADRGGGGGGGPAARLVPATAPSAANGSGGGGSSKVVKNGLKVEKSSPVEEVVTLFESESTDFGQSAFGVPVQRRVFLSNPTDATISISAITSSSISFHCSFVEQKSLASRQRTSFRVYFLPVLEQFGPQRELIKVHTSIGTFAHRVQGETGGNPYRIRSFLGIHLPLNATFSAPLSLHNPHTKTMVVSELFVSDCNVRIELNDGTTVAMQKRRWDGGDKSGGGRREAMDWRFRPFETREIGHAKVLGNLERNSTAFIVAKLRKIGSGGDGGRTTHSPSSASSPNGATAQRTKKSDTFYDQKTSGEDSDAKKAVPKEQQGQLWHNHRKKQPNPGEEGEGEEDPFAQLLVVAIGVQVTRRRGLFPSLDLLDFGLVRAGGGPVRPRAFSVFSSLERGVEIESVYVEGQSRGVYLQFESRPPISIRSDARGMPGAPVTVASVNIDTDTLLRTRHTDGKHSNDDENRENDGKFDDANDDDGEDGEEQQQKDKETVAKEGDEEEDNGIVMERRGRHNANAETIGGAQPAPMVSVRHGTVVAETRGGNYKVSIPFRALIYTGDLEHDTEATAFHHALEPIVRREVTVTNSLPFGLAVWGVELAENATTAFQASIVSHPAVTLSPGQSLPVLLLTYAQKQPANFVSQLILHTNVTTFSLPIAVFDGELLVRLYAHKQNEFDFGSVGWDERRTILFSLSNPNPVTLRLSRLHVPFPPTVLSLSFLGMQRLEQQQKHQQEDDNRPRGANVGQLVDKFSTNSVAVSADAAGWSEGLDFALPPHTFALFNLSLYAQSEHRNVVPHNGAGTFRLQTQFGAYEFPLKFELVDFRLESVPAKIVFQETFIGTVHTQPIKFFNTFPHDLRVHRLSIADADDDPRFQLFHHDHHHPEKLNSSAKMHQIIPPKSLLTVANVAFVPGTKCPSADDDCYLGIPLDTSDGQWFAYGMKLPQNLAEIDHYLYARLRQKWLALGAQKRVVRTQLRLDTDRVKNLEVPVEGHLVWPRLLSHSVVHFPLTAVGNFTIVNLTLSNPTTNAVIVQLLPLVIYPDAEFLLDLFRSELPVPLPDPVEMNETLMFSLRDTELFTLRPGSPVPQLREEVETILGGPVPRFTQTLLLRPGMSTRIRIGFLPNDYTLHSSLLLIRNNLTALEPVVLYGRGARMHMDIDNKTARSLPLLFEIQPQHLADCANPRRQLHKLPTTLTVRRSFVVRNSGEVSFSVFNISVSNTPCENRGFRVLNCDRFRLEPNETTLLDIAYTPDFLLTSNEATLQLYMHMNGTPWTFNLVATIPPQLLSVCHAALPRPPFESMMYYTCVLALTFCFICVVSCAYLEGDRVISCAYRQQFAPPISVDCQPQDDKVSALSSLASEKNGVLPTAKALVDDDGDNDDAAELLAPSRRTQFLQAAKDAGPLNKLFWRTLNFILFLFSYIWPLVRGGNKTPPMATIGRRKAARATTARKAQQQQQQKIALTKTQSVDGGQQHDDKDGQKQLQPQKGDDRLSDGGKNAKEIAAAKVGTGRVAEKGPTERRTTAPIITALKYDENDDEDADDDEEEEEEDDEDEYNDDDDVVQHPKDPEHMTNNTAEDAIKNQNVAARHSTATAVVHEDDGHGPDQDGVDADLLDLSDPYLYMKFRSFLDAEKKKSAALLAKESPAAAASGGKKQQRQHHISISNSSTTTTNSSDQHNHNQHDQTGNRTSSPKKKRDIEKKQRNGTQLGEEEEMTTPKTSRVPMKAAITERARKANKNGSNNKFSSTNSNGSTSSAASRGVSSSSTQTTQSSSSASSLLNVAPDIVRQQLQAKPIGTDAPTTFPLLNASATTLSSLPAAEAATASSSAFNLHGGVRPEWFDRLFASTTTTHGAAATVAQRGAGGTTTTALSSSTQQHFQRQQQQPKHRKRWPETADDEEEFGTTFVWEQLYATKMFQFEQDEAEEGVDEHGGVAQHLREEAIRIGDKGNRLLKTLSNGSDEATAADANSCVGDDESNAAPEWADHGIADFATGSVDADFFALADQSAEFFDQISNGSTDKDAQQLPAAGASFHTPTNYRHNFDEHRNEGTKRAEEEERESAATVADRLPIGWGKRLLMNAEDAKVKRIIDTLTEEYREKLTKVLNSARNPMLDMRQLLDDLCLSPATFKPSALETMDSSLRRPSAADFKEPNESAAPSLSPSSAASLNKSPGREFSARHRNGGTNETEGQKIEAEEEDNNGTTMAPSSPYYNSMFNIEDPVWKPIGPLDEHHWPAQFIGTRSGSKSRPAAAATGKKVSSSKAKKGE
ncbi:hypothetical protein niasHT_023612 [Heterodera trifolii]|uniref:Transmembrane protein 131 n=1 Tax=Heterodera trifolii TaxID=157864 RepID=A0ABD2JKB7_9BILA